MNNDLQLKEINNWYDSGYYIAVNCAWPFWCLWSSTTCKKGKQTLPTHFTVSILDIEIQSDYKKIISTLSKIWDLWSSTDQTGQKSGTEIFKEILEVHKTRKMANSEQVKVWRQITSETLLLGFEATQSHANLNLYHKQFSDLFDNNKFNATILFLIYMSALYCRNSPLMD